MQAVADARHQTPSQPAPDDGAGDVLSASVALLGEDYPGLRPRMEVAQGDLVAQGQILFRDAKRPAIAFASPVGGRVNAIELAARRMLSGVIISPDPDAPSALQDVPDAAADLRKTLLERGLWPAFVTRPFGGPPDPEAMAEAIIVAAVASGTEAPDPDIVMAKRGADLTRGLAALTRLTGGPVHLCLSEQSSLGHTPIEGVRVHRKRLTPRWRARSGQVATVQPPTPSGQVWTIGYQDVAAIGHLLATGCYDPGRLIGFRPRRAGPVQIRRVPLGCDLRALAGLPGGDSPGHPVTGAAAFARASEFLGRFDEEAGIAGTPLRRPPARPLPLIPITGLSSALCLDLPVVPLMRALAIGDAETCARLGCLDLLEEDMTALTARCASGTDYGQALRIVLEQLRKEAA